VHKSLFSGADSTVERVKYFARQGATAEALKGRNRNSAGRSRARDNAVFTIALKGRDHNLVAAYLF